MRRLLSLIIVLALVSGIFACNADTPDAGGPVDVTEGLIYDGSDNSWSTQDETLAPLAEKLKKQYFKYKDKGGIILLASSDQVIFIGGSDSVETDGSTKVGPYTTYEIGSITKTFTATAVLQLCEQGKISLDDRLGSYIPAYEKGKDLTIRQILHMNSGIQREFFTEEEQTDPDLFIRYYNDGFTDDELIASLNSSDLEFEPGTQYSYSNAGYTLLAMVIEKVTGERYCDYVQKNIFDVCGMEHSSSMSLGDVTSVPLKPPFGHYTFDIRKVFPDGYFMCPVSGRGAGDIHSCAADMIAFDTALMSGNLLGSGSLDEMFRLEMGYGCGMGEIERYEDCYGHFGATGSYYCLNMIIKTQGYGNLYLIELFPDVGAGSYIPTIIDELMKVI